MLQAGADMGFRTYLNPDKVARPGRAAGTTTLARGAAQKTSTKNIDADAIDSVQRQVPAVRITVYSLLTFYKM